MGENPNFKKFNELQKHIELILDAMLNFMKENTNTGKLEELTELIKLVNSLEANLYKAIHIPMLELCIALNLDDKFKSK